MESKIIPTVSKLHSMEQDNICTKKGFVCKVTFVY